MSTWQGLTFAHLFPLAHVDFLYNVKYITDINLSVEHGCGLFLLRR